MASSVREVVLWTLLFLRFEGFFSFYLVVGRVRARGDVLLGCYTLLLRGDPALAGRQHLPVHYRDAVRAHALPARGTRP